MRYQFTNNRSNINQEYYVTVDSIEQTENGLTQIVFDGIRVDQFNNIYERNLFDNIDGVIPHLFVIEVNNEFYDSFFPEFRTRNFNGKWFKLATTNSSSELPASLFIENTESPELLRTFIFGIDRIYRESEEAHQLLNFFSWNHFGLASTRRIKNHLDNIKPIEDIAFKLNVYNVGQGSLSAVTDHRNKPIFYFDLGGAWWLFPNSYPRTLRICTTKAKTVVLSHWDLDHVETARRLFYSNPAVLNGITWIVPKQTLTPMYIKLAAKMATSGILLFWSGNYINEISFWAGKLIKCFGPEKNHNGISLLVDSPNNTIKKVLHPGDAAYRYIPNLDELQLDGLVATHHGANFDINNSPIPSSIIENGAIAYSHDNKYGHPTPFSVSEHQNHNWKNIRETTYQSISFTIGLIGNLPPCGGNNCDLGVTQSF